MSTESVWLRPESGRPRRVLPLTRERIVAAAVTLLDEQGVEGLTMRRLAQQLDVTSTALYWHVKTKDDVLDLAVDRIFGDVPLPEPSGDWAEDVRSLARAWRAAMLRHPWTPRLVGRPMLGPNVLARTEFLQAALVRGGRDGLHLAVATRMVANYVIGAALTEATWRQTADPLARAAARSHLAALGGAYPTLNASGHLDDSRWDDDILFEEGLDGILLAVARTGRPDDGAPT
ncbi:TetR/AcrR family transcriptional regulator C-terminal domain-containing protein [Micromonospora sp. WMMD1120]|uniref:TetR/AcrR family transcriptional regulator C-terminal domain-containing protein n=1 Tax=Micromonospora sp. WMMD1120 TaxID=3016106 RepID=UPI002416F731|nr:TetR/AcrR family transcriptional regulator C-terminal domain-containing protein [Micromonospora sp. WMMD1120]MDG4810082.1 TetR/AcrR family transcriptional regulator C-terminal domain-containing protein [Micromonospora sp. WMMD1120]